MFGFSQWYNQANKGTNLSFIPNIQLILYVQGEIFTPKVILFHIYLGSMPVSAREREKKARQWQWQDRAQAENISVPSVEAYDTTTKFRPSTLLSTIAGHINVCGRNFVVPSYTHTPDLRKEFRWSQLALRAGIESWKSSFLWPYIIPANIPLGIQYYHPG